MAKKAKAKKTVKKAAKKAAKKSAKKSAPKKSAKKATRKAAKKSAPKKAAKKSAPKKAAKKAAKKAVKKTAKKAVKKTAKKAVKKVAKKAAPKKSAPKKATSKKSAPKKAAVKKAVKKVARPVKKTVKKAVRRAAPKPQTPKPETVVNNTMSHSFSESARDTMNNAADRFMPDRTSDDAPAYERPSSDDTGNDSDNDNRNSDSNDSEEEEDSSSDDEEEEAGRAVFVKHQTRLKPGDKAPWFEEKDQYGRTVGMDSFPGQSIVLYFYPKDDTEGCTAQSCSLRDGRFHLRDKNYVIVGVSADDAQSHTSFADKYNLPFPLLADTEMDMIRAFDVWGPKMLAGRVYDGIVRTTFIIDPGGTIRHVITDVDTQNHARQILELEEVR